MKLREVILCGLFIALITVGTFVRIPVGTDVYTLQFLFTLLAGLMLGARLGALAACSAGMVVVYVLGISYFYFASNYIIDAPIGFWVAVWYCGVLQVLPDFLLCVAAAYIGIRLYKAGLWIRETQEMQTRSTAPVQGAAVHANRMDA